MKTTLSRKEFERSRSRKPPVDPIVMPLWVDRNADLICIDHRTGKPTEPRDADCPDCGPVAAVYTAIGRKGLHSMTFEWKCAACGIKAKLWDEA